MLRLIKNKHVIIYIFYIIICILYNFKNVLHVYSLTFIKNYTTEKVAKTNKHFLLKKYFFKTDKNKHFN